MQVDVGIHIPFSPHSHEVSELEPSITTNSYSALHRSSYLLFGGKYLFVEPLESISSPFKSFGCGHNCSETNQ